MPPLEKNIDKNLYVNKFVNIETNNILMFYQSDFRVKNLCVTVQLTITKWKLLIDEVKYIVAVLLYFKSVFETIC